VKIVDLTHPIHCSMPVYPGSEPPSVEIACSIERDGFAEHRIRLFSHTGTHVDAPAHLNAGGKTLDRYPADHFVGNALIVDVSARSSGREIDLSVLEPFAGMVENVEFVLLRSGWSRYWGSPEYFSGYPVLNREAALRLSRFRLKGIGIDAVSFDRENDKDYPNHRTLLGRDILLVENLTDLGKLPDEPFLFSCLPMKIENAEGAPVRAVALLDR
jgi:kynurenine formamidase